MTIIKIQKKIFNFYKKLIKVSSSDIFIVAFFISSTLFFFAPSLIFLTNINEFSFTYREIFLFLLVITFVSSFASYFLLLFFSKLNKRLFKISLSFLFILGLLFWLQGNILTRNYGLFDGSTIIWENHILQTYINIAIWLSLFILAFTKQGFVLKTCKSISLFIITIQLIYTGVLFFRQPEAPLFKKYYIDESNKFNFSKGKNIIYLVLDTLQSDIFYELISEDKTTTRILDGFIFYPDTVSSYNRTDMAIPSLLTETEYHNEGSIEEWTKKSFQKCSLPKILKNNSFNTEIYAEYPEYIYFDKDIVSNYLPKTLINFHNIYISQFLKLTDVTLFRLLPDFLKRYIYNDQEWGLQNLKLASESKLSDTNHNVNTLTFIKKVEQEIKAKSQKNEYKLYHLFGTHAPYRIDRNLKYTKLEDNVEGYKEQGRAMISLIRIFINKLKENNLFDNSLIVILGDHGVGAYSSEDNKSLDMSLQENTNKLRIDSFVPKFRRKQANPILFIKPFNARGELKLDSKRAQLMDISTTVLSTLDLKSCSFSGINLLDEKVDTKKRVRINNFFPDIYQVDGDVRNLESWKTRVNKWAPGGKREAISVPEYKFGTTIKFGESGFKNNYLFDWFENTINLIWVEDNFTSIRFNLKSQPTSDILLKTKLSPFMVQLLFIYINGEKVTQLNTNIEDIYQIIIRKNLLLKGVNTISFWWPKDDIKLSDINFDYLSMDEIR